MDASEAPEQGATTHDGASRTDHPGQLMQITRAIVTIYKEQFGRGPEHAHSHYAGANTIICVLEGTLTPVERTLAKIGQTQELQNLRQLFQSAAEQAFRAAVEQITGRQVVSFMSGNDVRNDMASEIFVLATERPPEPQPRRE
jgi:uncharacterized protein YbcI